MYSNPFFNGINSDIYRNQIAQPIQPFSSTPLPFQFNPYVQNQQVQFPQQQNLSIRRVSSIEEAKAAMIDPLGTYFFVDTGTGKIYMKQIKNDGAAEFYIFGVENVPENSSKENENPLIEISKRLSNIETALGGIANVQSVSGNAGGKQSDAVPQSAVAEPHEPDGTAEPAGVPDVAANDFWKKRR